MQGSGKNDLATLLRPPVHSGKEFTRIHPETAGDSEEKTVISVA